MASSDLVWAIIRDNHAFLKHQRGIRKTFSLEAGNLKNFNSPRYCGFNNRTSIDIKAAVDGKGLVLTTTHPVGTRMVKKATSTVSLKKNPRRVYRSIRSGLKGKKVQPKIRNLALRRASAILSSQRVKPTEAAKLTEKSTKSTKK
ncbi:hypothetical protein RvY_07263 [Ramazzottius varieornatus]|uniref:Large ribosomal subunit protein eL28 n=1 Tax=Ramazzottius varieornatus TaxID=947166 RepID=A0A1D1V1Q4_RAMVA|nr:hypothetical protein RvY_07263 [Ramazzottius varieornatus]